jgi:hypothetical protein
MIDIDTLHLLVGDGNQYYSRVLATDSSIELIDIGQYFDNNFPYSGQAGCLQYLAVAFEVERDGSDHVAHCSTFGYASDYSAQIHKYSVQAQDSSTWQAFFDGVNPGGHVYTSTWSQAGASEEWGSEVAYCDSCSLSASNASTTFGGALQTPAQRYALGGGWTTVNQTNGCNGPAATCVGGSWTFDLSSWPTEWTVSR